MMRLESDLVEIMLACALGNLAGAEARFSDQCALTVVMAANGYPGTPEKGGVIDLGDAEADGAKVFHAGTGIRDGALVASGGRVLNITALGASVGQAQQRAYAALDKVSFPAGFCRRDIGWREVAREAAGACSRPD
jgi:phosphoribosylamine--glycine ligase